MKALPSASTTSADAGKQYNVWLFQWIIGQRYHYMKIIDQWDVQKLTLVDENGSNLKVGPSGSKKGKEIIESQQNRIMYSKIAKSIGRSEINTKNVSII